MKIQSAAGFDQYKKYVQGLKGSESTQGRLKGAPAATAAANTDKVIFSEKAAAQAEIGRIATNLSAEIEEAGGEARLAALSEEVAQGNYFVESENLISSILGQV